MTSVHESSLVLYRFLLLAGWTVSLVGGFWLDQTLRVRPLEEFHRQANMILADAVKSLEAYQEMQDVPYDRFQLPEIIAKGGFQEYLDGMLTKPYVGLVDKLKWLPADLDADPSFCRKWGEVAKKDVQIMVWHLRVPQVAAGKARKAGRASCAGALELRFDTEKLFAHVFKAALEQGMGVRIHAYGPSRASPDRNIAWGQVFSRGAAGEEGEGPWAQEFSADFYTFRLHIVLSAPLKPWNAEWPGLVFFTVAGALSWTVYRWLRRRQERARREAEEAVERHLRDRGQELIQQQRREDISLIRHWLAQPLTGVSGCLEGLLIRLEDANLPQEILERDLRNAFRFTGHAVDFLGELREQLAGQLGRQRRNVALAEIFHDVAALAGADPRFHGVELSVGEAAGLRVMVSPAGLEMVLLNLLRNSAEAIRDERKGGRVSLRAWGEEGRVKIRVEDDGPGLGWTDGLFVPFRTSKDYGTGLGLVHCKSLVESHGGTIAGGNRPEGGAWFEIDLPLFGEEAAGREAA